MAQKKKSMTDQSRFMRATHYQGKLKFYSKKEFEEFIDKFKKRKDGTDSNGEKLFLSKLGNTIKYRAVRNQISFVPYTHKHKQHMYTPDFVVLDKHGHVIVVEIKAYAAMGELTVIKKYEKLKNICKQYGFRYAMITKRFTSFEQIAKQRYCKDVYDYLFDCLNNKGKFNRTDYLNLHKKLHISQETLNKELTKIIIQKHLILKGSLIYKLKTMIIKKRR